MTRARQALGAAGEDLAAAWYESRGYEVLARNWRCRDGELDLVLRRGPTIVFCEVKARSSLAFGSPLEAVTPRKCRRIRRLAAAWLDQAGRGAPELRFDVAAVL
ncbi:MAG: YraN family protein, partial [Actinomycetota bacterium]|nr:YraN family protein [Actinomycetota bacterium]